VKQLRGSKALIVSKNGQWSAGDNLPNDTGQEWIEGRAAWAVQLLEEIDTVSAEQNIVSLVGRVEDEEADGAVS
jgi:hypothetical protein